MNRIYSPPAEAEILALADKYLAPYTVRNTEIIPETCPFCQGGDSGDKRTFYLSLRTGQYICHRAHCSKRGGFPSLLRHFGEKTTGHSVAEQFTPIVVQPKRRTEDIEKYFRSRGISSETLDAYQVVADASGNILFPFFVEGELVYAKYRHPRPVTKGERKEWQQVGARPVLFGMDLCEPGKPLIITEGQIDALSLYEAGIRNVVSVPCGCENLDWVEPCWEWMEAFDKIILFGDNDPPGKKMIRTLAARIGEDRCLVVEDYPSGCKDANDILQREGADSLKEALASAKEPPIRGVVDLADVEYVDPTTVPRIKTMVPALDESINGLEEGAITVFTGESGNGKSTLCGLLLLNAIEQGHTVCAFSGELSEVKFQEWINLQCAGSEWITLKYDSVKGKNVPVVYPPAQQRIKEWYKGKFFLFSSTEEPTSSIADSILQVFTMCARRRGCKLFLVDNIMTALLDSTDEENRAQARFIGSLKRFAVRYGVHVLVVAHPRKTKAGTPITKDDVGGNKMITNLASNAIVVEKPDLRVIKARDCGYTRLIECCYAGDSRRVYQASVGDMNKFSWNKEGLTPPSVRADSVPEYGVQFSQQQPF